MSVRPSARAFAPVSAPSPGLAASPFGALVLALFAFVAALSAAPAAAEPAAGEAAPAAPRPKILFLTHSAGFKHGSLPVAERVVKEMGDRTGVFEAVTLEGYKANAKEIDLSFLTAEYLKDFAAVMFFTTGELPLTEEQKTALIDFVRKDGKAWIGAHSATDTFYEWPAYMEELSGGYFKTHGPNHKELVLKVEDPNHPATKMLGSEWVIADEFYQYREGSFSRERSRVLLSVDTAKSDLAPQRMSPDGDYPLAWCRMSGAGRSFYTALGHRDDMWENPKFQEHLLGGIKWALGLEPGDATPSANTN